MLTLRAAVPDDAYDIVRINVECWRRAYAGMVPDDVLDAMDIDARAERYRRRMVEGTRYETLVATDGPAVVGYVSLGPYRDGEAVDETVGEILAIYVDPRRWRGGAGRLLVTAALARLAEHGWDETRLWVLEANDSARRFYADLGFRPDGLHAVYPMPRPGGGVVELAEVRYAKRAGPRTG
jgi:ribosomal protein S18 acetylase RimI-like enzyme